MVSVAAPYVSVAISILALAFTVTSFWWLHARPGRLIGAEPDSFAMGVTHERSAFRFPVVVYNKGARTRVVESLRLVVADCGGLPIEWKTTRKSLYPLDDDVLDFRSAFAVDGRKTTAIFAEFGETPPTWTPELGSTPKVRIEFRLLGKDEVAPSLRLHTHHPDRPGGPAPLHHAPGGRAREEVEEPQATPTDSSRPGSPSPVTAG